ncbi:MAG: sulfatase-like hydrolase/transferase [Pirellulales bacterium]
MTAEQKSFQAAKMAVHAAMVDRMDQEIGRIVEHLRDKKLLDDTLILFLSDNGASAEIMVRGDGHDPQAPAGSAETFLCLGPGWSSLCNAPLRRHKTWVHEGGISTPLIAHWPRRITDKGGLRTTPVHVIDVAPTVLGLAGATGDASQLNDAPARPGEEFASLFARDVVRLERTHWWSHEGNQALRDGDWKIVKTKKSAWELYDLSTDRAETRNVVATQPERLRTLSERWETLDRRFTHDAKRDMPASTKE